MDNGCIEHRLVSSSSRKSFGDSASARAIATRPRWPPEFRHRTVGEAQQMDELQQFVGACSASSFEGAADAPARNVVADRRCGNSAAGWAPY